MNLFVSRVSADQRHSDGVTPTLPNPVCEHDRADADQAHGASDFPPAAAAEPFKSEPFVATSAEQFVRVGLTDKQESAAALAPAPSEKSFELLRQLETLTQDFARASGSTPVTKPSPRPHEEPSLSAELPAVDQSIRISPALSDIGENVFVPRRAGKRIVLLAVAFALLSGAAIVAWQPSGSTPDDPAKNVQLASAETSGNSVDHGAIPKMPSRPAEQADSKQPVTSPSGEFLEQINAITKDLAALRNTVEQLASRQQQLAASQQQLEQLAVAQQDLAGAQKQLAAKQEQMVQNIARLQKADHDIKRSVTAQPRPIPTQARRTAPAEVTREQPAPLPPPPSSRPANHPTPPLPIPPDYVPVPR